MMETDDGKVDEKPEEEEKEKKKKRRIRDDNLKKDKPC